MKTRREIYEEETEEIIWCLSVYKTMLPEQIYRLFPEYDPAMAKSVVTKQIHKRRIFYNRTLKFLAAREDITLPDRGMIAAIWVMLAHQPGVSLHIPGDYPVKLCFLLGDKLHEVIYAAPGEELLIGHALTAKDGEGQTRIIVVEDPAQIEELFYSGDAKFCTVSPDGEIGFIRKKECNGT